MVKNIVDEDIESGRADGFSDNGREWADAVAQENEKRRQLAIQIDAQIKQAAQRQRMSASMNILGGMTAVCEAGKKQREAAANIKNDMLSSLCITARRNGGYVPQDALGYASRVLGKQITGAGFNKGNLVITSPSTIRDPQTGRQFVDNFSPYAVVDKFTQAMALQRSMLAPDMRGELIDLMIQDGVAPNELRSRGLVDPRGVQQVGGTATFKGADTRPRGVHAFSSDGNGGFSSSDWTPEGGETRRDWGTRDPNYNGRWKVRVNGPDGKVYENDKTGEEITVKSGENLRDVLMKSEGKSGQASGAGVEIAKINAASREKVAGMTIGSRERIAEGNNQTRKEIAGAQISSREKIAEAANALKELGIDVSAALKERGYDLQEARDAETARHNKEGEGIAGSRQREHERHNKEQERLRGKSVEERERHNRAGEATAERRADTQERRVEDQYELGDRKQTHNENRLEQDKAKSGRSADQRDAELAERKRQFDEREKRLSKPKDQGGSGEDSRKAVSAMKGMLELARTSGMSDEDLADLESWTNERIKGMAGMGGETSGDGGAKGKVKYTDLKPGQKFTMTDKDGKKRRCVKTEKGYKFID